MLRRIWRRAAALALPVTLAIFLPPLAVIAFNLRATSTAASTAQTTRSVSRPASRSEQPKSSEKSSHETRKEMAQQISASDRN